MAWDWGRGRDAHQMTAFIHRFEAGNEYCRPGSAGEGEWGWGHGGAAAKERQPDAFRVWGTAVKHEGDDASVGEVIVEVVDAGVLLATDGDPAPSAQVVECGRAQARARSADHGDYLVAAGLCEP